MSKTGFQHVREFHEKFNHPIHSVPTVPEAKIVKLRLALILEEFIELTEACVNEESETSQELLQTLHHAMHHVKALTEENLNVSVVDVADALTDINYVTYGAGHCFGVNLDACMEEVQRSNMSKLGADGQPIYNEHGKVMKGPNYQPPDLVAVLGQ
jgi:predicted HAD superfamily Cof-like phosphohydrolase